MACCTSALSGGNASYTKCQREINLVSVVRMMAAQHVAPSSVQGEGRPTDGVTSIMFSSPPPPRHLR